MTHVSSSGHLHMTRPDDWHVHFRDGAMLADTVPPIARVFGRAVAMPNLRPPVTTTAEALAYGARLGAAADNAPYRLRPSPTGTFTPLPSLYLTDRTEPDEIQRARAAGLIAAKLYPAGATTHSDAGVTDLAKLAPVLRAMAECGLVLQLHGEVTDSECDIFEREARFVTGILAPLCDEYPDLRIVLEHVTTAIGVTFVQRAGANVVATITAHHLEVDRSDLFRGGLRPHLYCLPVPKTRADRDAVLAAAFSADPHFFLGSDSAPHPKASKESACCPAGVYTGHDALLYYADIFDRHGALDGLEAFASHHGADFYRLPRNPDTIILERAPHTIAASYRLGTGEVVPYRAGEQLAWRIAEA